MTRARERAWNGAPVPEPGREASFEEVNCIKIGPAKDGEDLITANYSKVQQGTSSKLTSDPPPSRYQPGDSVQTQATAESLQGLFPVFYVWNEEAGILKNSNCTTRPADLQKVAAPCYSCSTCRSKVIKKANVQLIIGHYSFSTTSVAD